MGYKGGNCTVEHAKARGQEEGEDSPDLAHDMCRVDDDSEAVRAATV